MTSRAFVYRSATFHALVLALSCNAVVARAAPTLRVRAKVHLELQSQRAGDGVRLHGVLRDDLAVPLAGRELLVRVQASTGHVDMRTLRTDSAGRFAMLLASRDSDQRASISFEGDEFYERAEAELTVDLERSELQLRFVQPSDWRIDLDDKSTHLELQASSDLGGAELSIEVHDELGRPIAEGKTDGAGSLGLDIASQRLGEVGLGELTAASAGDATRAATRVTLPVLRTRATRLHLQVKADAKSNQVHVALQLATALGPVAQRAVGVFIDGAHAITLLTDRAGAASRDFATDSLGFAEGSHEAQARFDSDAPGWLPSQSERVAFAIAEQAPRSAAWLIVPALASLAFVLWSLRRARVLDEQQIDLPSNSPTVRFGAADRGHAALHTIDGRVEDVENGVPLAAALEIAGTSSAAFVLRADAFAGFATADLPADTYRVRVHVAGYAGAAFEVRVPHAGTASGIVIGLRSLRSAALDAHAPVARRVLHAEARLNVATVRDTLEAAVSGNTAGAPLARLTELVERTAYARSTPNDRDLAEVQRAAAAAIADLEARSSSSGDPSLEQ